MALDKVHHKVLLVGDHGCGKTYLLERQVHGIYPTYVHVVDTYVQDVKVGGRLVQLLLWDTAGQEELDSIRTLLYPNTHVVLVCFNVDSRKALVNVETLWIPELAHHISGVPFLLVCTKVDLRNDPATIERLQQQGQTPVLLDEGQAVAQRIGAAGYYECLARQPTGVAEVFQAAVQASIATHGPPARAPRKRDRCTVV